MKNNEIIDIYFVLALFPRVLFKESAVYYWMQLRKNVRVTNVFDTTGTLCRL